MATNARQRLVFEPLRGKAVGLSRDLTRGHYVPAGTDDPALRSIFERIFDGRVRGLWIDRANTARLPRGRVIKDCLGTNLASFVAQNFPEVPLVFLLRHPIATAYSVTQLGWPDDLDPLLANRNLLEDQFAEQLHLIESVASHERESIAAVVLRWCLENSLPVRTLPPGSAHFVFYETLLTHPQQELGRLAEYLGNRSPRLWRDWHPDASLLTRPSGTAWRDADSSPTNEQRIGGWCTDISHHDLRRSIEVLDSFGLSQMYGQSVEPQMAAGAIAPPPHPVGQNPPKGERYAAGI